MRAALDAATAAETAAMPMVNYRRRTTRLEYRPSRQPPLDGLGRPAHAYGSQGRARHVPDQVVGQGSSRPLADRLIDLPTRVAARRARDRGTLIRIRSVVQVDQDPQFHADQAPAPSLGDLSAYPKVLRVTRREVTRGDTTLASASPGVGSRLPPTSAHRRGRDQHAPVCVFASGPAREAERLRAGLRGQWRQAAWAVMVLLALLELHPATVRRHLGVPRGRGARVLSAPWAYCISS